VRSKINAGLISQASLVHRTRSKLTRSSATAEMARVGARYAVQGH